MSERLTKREAGKMFLELLFEALEQENCEPTGRILEPHQEGLTEWRSTIEVDLSGKRYYLSVYYMTDEGDDRLAESDGWDYVPWPDRIDRYTLEAL